MAKTNGADLKAFFNDKGFWPDDDGETYYEDAAFTVNGRRIEYLDPDSLAETDQVQIKAGWVSTGDFKNDSIELTVYFRRWQRQRDKEVGSRRLLVECDSAVLEAVKTAVKAAGGKVL